MLGAIVNFFGGWQTKLVILALVLSSLFAYHKIEVSKAVTQAVSDIQTQQAKENFRIKERSFESEVALKESFDKIQKDKDDKIKSLDSRVATLASSLQSRPSRTESSGVSNDSRVEETRQGSTGLELYREDAIAFIGEAARAELIKEELLTCYRLYDTAKETLDKFKAENKSKVE